MRRALNSSVIFVAISASACTYAFPIRIEGNLQTPEVVIDRIGLFRIERPCLSSVTVSPAASPNQPVWNVRHPSLGCVELDRVAYGHLPNGFIEPQAAEPLEAGVVYEVWASAPGGRGVARVSYVDGRWCRLE